MAGRDHREREKETDWVVVLHQGEQYIPAVSSSIIYVEARVRVRVDHARARKQGVLYVQAWPQNLCLQFAFPGSEGYVKDSSVDELQQPPV